MYGGIEYIMNKKRVRQKLHTMSIYDLQGTFDHVIGKLQEEKKYYIEHYGTNPTSVKVYDSYYKYADGEKEKTVVFDKFEIEQEEEYGDKIYVVYGERDFLPEEVEFFKKKEEADTLERQKKELAQLEALKKKYEGG